MNELETKIIQVRDGQVFTQKRGSGPVSILTIPGGPGLSHEVFENFPANLNPEGFSVIFYDPVGSYHSDKGKNYASWDIEHYTDELNIVIDELGLDDFILYGHSMGASIVMEYALKDPSRLKALVLSNMMADIDLYEKYIQNLFEKFSEKVQKQFKKLIAVEAFDEPEFQQMVLDSWYKKHICRMDPWPESMNHALQQINTELLLTFVGPNPFEVEGNLKHWSAFDRLDRITIPTLVMGAENDSMDPDHLREMAGRLPFGTYTHCNHGGHFNMWDDTEQYFQNLIGFLKKL